MIHPTILTLVLLCSAPGANGPVTTAPTSRPAAREAALLYHRAFTALPELNDEEKQVIDYYDTAPLNTQALRLIERAQPALDLMHQAAAHKQCDWDLDVALGPDMDTSYLDDARKLGRVAYLRSRHDIEQGNTERAYGNLVALMRMGRHVRSDGNVGAWLTGSLLEDMAIFAAAGHLPTASEKTMTALPRDLGALPAARSARLAVLRDKQIYSGFMRESLRADGGDFAARILEMVLDHAANTAERNAVRAALLAEGGNAETLVLKWLDESDALYNELADLMELPFDRFKPAAVVFDRKVGQASWLAKTLLSGGTRWRCLQAYDRARRAMLLAAIDVVLKGRPALKQHKDPFGDGSFEYRPLGNGAFELKSKLVIPKRGPTTLTVGRAPRPERANVGQQGADR